MWMKEALLDRGDGTGIKALSEGGRGESALFDIVRTVFGTDREIAWHDDRSLVVSGTHRTKLSIDHRGLFLGWTAAVEAAVWSSVRMLLQRMEKVCHRKSGRSACVNRSREKAQ